jgi:hypothetical protein
MQYYIYFLYTKNEYQVIFQKINLSPVISFTIETLPKIPHPTKPKN